MKIAMRDELLRHVISHCDFTILGVCLYGVIHYLFAMRNFIIERTILFELIIKLKSFLDFCEYSPKFMIVRFIKKGNTSSNLFFIF